MFVAKFNVVDDEQCT